MSAITAACTDSAVGWASLPSSALNTASRWGVIFKPCSRNSSVSSAGDRTVATLSTSIVVYQTVKPFATEAGEKGGQLLDHYRSMPVSSDRHAAIRRLADETFDVLVIGGGITGAGVALDAASRGLRVALAERRDLASGTSSKS